jgi:hypothetical protein
MRHGLLSLSLALCTAAAAIAARGDPAFDGVWQGTLEVVSTHGSRQDWPLGDDASTIVRLELRGESAQLEFANRPIVPPAEWRVATHDAAALVYRTNVLNGYVGTWQLSLTKTNADTVLVFGWRVSTTAESAAVAQSDAQALRGELKRVPANKP